MFCLNKNTERLGKKMFQFQLSLTAKTWTRRAHWCEKCYLASRKTGPWDDSMKMESSIELTACTWWVTLPSSSANSMAPHSATRALNLLRTAVKILFFTDCSKSELRKFWQMQNVHLLQVHIQRNRAWLRKHTEGQELSSYLQIRHKSGCANFKKI